MKTVVAALIRGKEGKYLIAKRLTGDPELVGKWEFPGGKVEPGETDEEALEREIIEEFDTLIAVGGLRAKTQIDDKHILKLYDCSHKLGPYRLKEHSELKWLDIPQISDYDLAPADKDLLSQFIGDRPSLMLSDLKIGNSYKNADIVSIFGVSPQGGMRKTKNILVLVSKHDDDNPYDDRWENGKMQYTGMGPTGDQSIDYRFNKTLANSKIEGTKVYYFESFGDGDYIYRGRVELDGEPYYDTQKGKDGKPRKVVKFPLKMID